MGVETVRAPLAPRRPRVGRMPLSTHIDSTGLRAPLTSAASLSRLSSRVSPLSSRLSARSPLHRNVATLNHSLLHRTVCGVGDGEPGRVPSPGKYCDRPSSTGVLTLY
jgi:hypothetical protein